MVPPLLILLTVAGVAGAVGTSLTMQNLPPEIVRADVVFHASSARFDYEVHARDGNGLLDLDHVVIHFFDRTGLLRSHPDGTWRPVAAEEGAIWAGTTEAAPRDVEDHVRVMIEVFDKMGGRATRDAQVTVALLAEPSVRGAGMPAGHADERAVRGSEGPEDLAAGGLTTMAGLMGAYMLALIIRRTRRGA